MSTAMIITTSQRSAHEARRQRLQVIGLPAVKPASPLRFISAATPFNFLATPGWRAIVKLVALKHQTTVADILSSRRDKAVAAARHHAMALVYTHCPGISMPQVGARFCRDHTTVLYALRKMGVVE